MTTTIATLTVMRGEHERLPRLLDSLSWTDERHVVETAPEPLDRAHYEGFTFHHHPLPAGASFEAARQAAVAHVEAPWILVVDTDEVIPPELASLLVKRIRTDWDDSDVEGVWIPRRNHVLGRALEHSSAWPDHQLRLIRRSAARFRDRLHSGMPDLGPVVRLPADPALAIQHHNLPSTFVFMEKVNLYTSIEADQSRPGGSVWRGVWAALRDFLARYGRMRGYRDGPHGLHFAVLMAIYRYLTEAKRWERNELDTRS